MVIQHFIFEGQKFHVFKHEQVIVTKEMIFRLNLN